MSERTPAQTEISARLDAVEEAIIVLAAATPDGAKHFVEQLRMKVAWCDANNRPEAERAAHVRLFNLARASGLG
jgi:hypothetical protein